MVAVWPRGGASSSGWSNLQTLMYLCHAVAPARWPTADTSTHLWAGELGVGDELGKRVEHDARTQVQQRCT